MPALLTPDQNMARTDEWSKESERLKGKVVLLYGGGAPAGGVGVGQAAAWAYAAAGAQIAIVDYSLENAERTAELLSPLGQPVSVIKGDITDPTSIAKATQATIASFGRIDVLHNNVGWPLARAFDEYADDEWLRGMHLNCVGAAATIRSALPHLLDAKGVIINISSVAGIRYTGMNYAVYSAGKAALNQLTIAVALEYASRGIRANAIVPGLLDTEMGRGLPAAGASRAERSPTGAQGSVWDVANDAIYLASDDARYVNGHLLVVDGGLSARC
jgi:NAD(P)-dependent dehydrogenase (short-subunit alcohol dehydrogenase family)